MLPQVATDHVVDRARAGDAVAFTQIYREFSPSVLGYLRGKGVDDAEAVTNDVFLVALRTIGSFTGGVAELRRYIFTIAHARMVDDARRRIRHPPASEYEPHKDSRLSESAEEEALYSLDRFRLDALLAQLNPDQKEVLLLRLAADLSLAEVAAIMGKSQGSIKQLQRRGLIALRKLLGPTEGRHSWHALLAR